MTNFAGFMAYTIIYGFFEGCISVSTFKIIEEVAGEKNIDAGYTVQIVGNSIFLLAGPPTAGKSHFIHISIYLSPIEATRANVMFGNP